MDELEFIVKKSDNNKSPGLDGLSYEFYKGTWDVIKFDLREVLQCQLNRQRLVNSNKEGVTRLCSKVTGVPSVEELRPITLLNCDYKLLSKFLVSKLRPNLKYIIKSGQLCSVENKNILFGISNIISSILAVKSQKSQACIISLDFFKAYDRVFLGFLLKVMRKMNFGDMFISWIAMLHEDATTRFILNFLTEAIDVNFSIQQGDPIAMLLYIIYVEPLLMALEQNLIGLQIPRFISSPEVLEAYCDDLNVITNNEEDIRKMSCLIEKFEQYSGAILSRHQKCLILGLGKWAGKSDWPISWLKSVKYIKIFGIFISGSYNEILNKNWEYRVEKLRNVLISWSSRVFSSLEQRIEIVKIFGLSRIYYVASILPIRAKFVQKMESMIGKFLWLRRGSNLRIALDELKNDSSSGGLNLPCISTMNRSLLSSQCLRLLKSSDAKSKNHLLFWMGTLLVNILPSAINSFFASDTPEHFSLLGDCFATLMIDDILTSSTLSLLTNKMIYRHFSKFPQPKIISDNPTTDYNRIWKRLSKNFISGSTRDTMFLLAHNKLAVPERLSRTGYRANPFCSVCPGDRTADLVHVFCHCFRTRNCWRWLRSAIVNMTPVLSTCTDWQLLNLDFRYNNQENQVSWLISTFVDLVWTEFHHVQNGQLDLGKVFGFLTFKYRMVQNVIGTIPFLN